MIKNLLKWEIESWKLFNLCTDQAYPLVGSMPSVFFYFDWMITFI